LYKKILSPVEKEKQSAESVERKWTIAKNVARSKKFGRYIESLQKKQMYFIALAN
jgi:hypothetical protein